VDLPAFRGELAAALNKRARIQGGSLSADPRLRRVLERAADEAKRLKDEYVSTEHLLLAIAEGAATLRRSWTERRQHRGDPRGPHEHPRRPARDEPEPESTYQALEKYGRDLTAEARAGKLDPVNRPRRGDFERRSM